MLPGKLSRYAAVATLLFKHRPDLLAASANTTGASDATPAGEQAEAERLTRDLENLGPTFIKLGQLLSTRADLLPAAYLEALSRLQDDVAPVPLADVQKTIEEDLGIRLSKAFASFEPEPIASASLGQVHRATLRDGRPVAVKVQRPNVVDQVVADLEALDEIAAFIDTHTKVGRRYEFAPMIREFRRSLMNELDYTIEAGHLRRLGHNLAEFTRLIVPAPVEGYICRRVLVMDYVTGTKITRLNPVALIDIDLRRARRRADQRLSQADSHRRFLSCRSASGQRVHHRRWEARAAGSRDGRTPVADVSGRLLKLVLAISEGRGEEAADAAIALGEEREDMDESGFKRDVVRIVGQYLPRRWKSFRWERSCSKSTARRARMASSRRSS